MRFLPICAALAIAAPAYAMETPLPTAKDQNARTVPYDPGNPVVIVTNVKRMTNITFATGERVEHMMFGDDNDATAPAGGPSKDELQNNGLLSNAPIWGKKVGVTTLTILTLMPDSATERTYKFVVKVKPESADLDPDATYWLTFSYTQAQMYQANPAAKEAAQVVAAKVVETRKQRQDREAREALEASLREDVHNGPRNWRYLAMGDSSIAPCYDCIFDNSRMTAFWLYPNTPAATVYVVDTPAWCDATRPAPSEYLKAPDGRLAPVSTKNGLTVIEETDPHFRFRLGQRTVDIFNCGYTPIGAPDSTLRTAQQ